MSGFPGGDLYGGPEINRKVWYQYQPQLGGGILMNPSILPPNPKSSLLKTPLAEFEGQQQVFLLRSVKQRGYQTSPISPLSPSDSSSSSSSIPPPSQPTNSSNFSFSAFPDSEKKMRNRLKELEKQLLDDNEEEDEKDGNGGASDLIGECYETMKNLIKPLSSSPSSSSNTTSSSSSSSSSYQFLLDSVMAIYEGKIETAKEILSILKQISNPLGDPEQRLTGYMVKALLSRINPPENYSPIAELSTGDHHKATQMLYEASPCFKLGFMAANQAILESTHHESKLHFLDFEIGQGSQYITLIHNLAQRNSVKPSVKITAVTEPNGTLTQSLQLVHDELTKLGERVGLSVRFNVICSHISNLTRGTLGCEPDEALVVNFAFRLYKMPDESVSTANPRDELLRRVKGLNPRVVTLVEQEMNSNTAPFVARFTEALTHYRALFESLDATMGRDSENRVRVEECLGRKATNSVAREGRERVERCEVFGKWRARMGMAGFELRPLGSNLAKSMRSRLALFRHNTNSAGFFVKEEIGGLCFGWNGRVLTVASAWN